MFEWLKRPKSLEAPYRESMKELLTRMVDRLLSP